jgi:glycosyltransferase involved in cell wall biosynthesis
LNQSGHIKITIITVTYNAQEFILTTLKSVKNQTFSNYEHLFIDGASKDGTLSTLKGFTNDKIRVYSEPDKGLYDAMNKGIAKAQGEYIFFLNAGDQFLNEHTLSQIFEKSNGEDFLYGDVLVIDQNGNTRPYHKIKPTQENISYKSFLYGMVICHQAMFVKKALAATFQDQKYKISADIDWSIRTLKNCNTFYDTNQVISLFLDGGVSQTNKRKALLERFYISIDHFGILSTIFVHFIIVIQFLINKLKT